MIVPAFARVIFDDVSDGRNTPLVWLGERHHPLVTLGESRVWQTRLDDRHAAADDGADPQRDSQKEYPCLHNHPAR